MAIALVQKKHNYSASAAVSAVFDAPPTAGNLMVAVGYGSSVIGNASIAGWSVAVSSLRGATATGAILRRVVQAGDSATVTLSWTSSSSTFLNIMEFSGITAATLDKTASAYVAENIESRSSGTTASTTVADELCIAGWAISDITSSQSVNNSFTLEQNNGSMCFSAYRIVSSAAAYETTLSWTTARYACGMIATFMNAPTTWIPKVIIIS